MESLEAVCELLIIRKRQDLADLLRQATIDYDLIDFSFDALDDTVDFVQAVISAPIPAYDQLQSLPTEAKQYISSAVSEVCYARHGRNRVIRGIRYSFIADSSDFGEGESMEGGFEVPAIDKLPVSLPMLEIIEYRLKEAQVCVTGGAYLAATILWGSVLEAALLGAAMKDKEKFNRSDKRPIDRRSRETKKFSEWKLSNFIDVALDTGLLKQDIREPGRALREFRNYIHPNKEAESGFRPDEYTARISFDVLKAALADLSGDR